MRIRERLIIPGLTLALLLALAGCGGGNGGDPSTPASLFQPTPQGGDEPRSAPTATPRPAASAGDDRKTLAAVFNALGLSAYVSDAPLNEWGRGLGVEMDLIVNTTTGTEYVVRLNMYESEMSGKIPPELGDLSNLEILELDGNALSGGIPPELGNLSNLVTLSIQNGRLAGGIPPEIGGLSNLEVLELDGNQLTGGIPPELGNLSNLKSLTLEGNRLSGCVPAALEAQLTFAELGGLAFC